MALNRRRSLGEGAVQGRGRRLPEVARKPKVGCAWRAVTTSHTNCGRVSFNWPLTCMAAKLGIRSGKVLRGQQGVAERKYLRQSRR